jgi:hypothetical protein
MTKLYLVLNGTQREHLSHIINMSIINTSLCRLSLLLLLIQVFDAYLAMPRLSKGGAFKAMVVAFQKCHISCVMVASSFTHIAHQMCLNC